MLVAATSMTSNRAAAQAWSCRLLYGTSAFRKTVRDSAPIGWKGFVWTMSLPKAVKSSGAVSPAARAIASRAPVTIPPSAAGTTISRVTRQRGAPSARHATAWNALRERWVGEKAWCEEARQTLDHDKKEEHQDRNGGHHHGEHDERPEKPIDEDPNHRVAHAAVGSDPVNRHVRRRARTLTTTVIRTRIRPR